MSPFTIKSGETVALICTGTPCDSPLDAELAAQYLREHLQVNSRYGTDTYTSLPAVQRAQILLDYLADPSIKAIWSLRGGEGTADLIPYLAEHERAIRGFSPKLLIGFSDFTPLLVYFRQHFGWPTIHGAGARQLPKKMINSKSAGLTLRWLTESPDDLCVSTLEPLNQPAFVEGNYQGEVIGGNLTLLGISVADRWQLKPTGKLLLLEEVNEEPYKVARTLKYLARIHFFDGARAIILGGFDFPAKSALENQQKFIAMRGVLQQFAETMPIPVFYTSEIGHGDNNLPIPFYVTATLVSGLNAHCRFSSTRVHA